ncbi:hypothetical protein [Erwinia piriflorinigrans]|uniref:Uncharacterized protein n=1 Tax=Erwinia piriflorinigrans CFBP 5888 TaxID=1161919 RepID=V5Z399_9GAMM|nr:hypothetical protein [Erwinia piriflorinigrans]CCG85428.1 hypothetical protein EPIR_0063 [Erwinia piriflorinigrans CFBP 5888]
MSHEITLEQAAEMAHQSEIIARLIESHPHQMQDCEIIAIVSLLSRLTGSVTAWLIEELAQREASR